MKLKSFLAIAALSLASFVACEELQQQAEEASIALSPAELFFDETGEPSQEIVLNVTRDWRLSGSAPEWLALSKSSGTAGEYNISVSAEPNTGNDREAELLFTIGLYNASLTVKQTGAKGELTYEQISCKEFIEKADTNTVYRLSGKVSGFNSKYCSFKLTDDSQAAVTVYEVNNNGDWKEVIKNGGTATVRGKYKLYTSAAGAVTHEMVAAYIEEFIPGEEGTPQGTGTKEDPYNPAGIARAVANLTWTSTTEYESTDPVYVKGRVSAITEEFSTQFGNASFTLVDENDGSGYFEAYRVLYVGNKKFASGDTQIKVGDIVIVYGKVMNYQNTTAETASGAFVYELNGVSNGGVIEQGTPDGDGSLENPFNPSAATQAVARLTWTSTTEYDKVGPYFIEGLVSSIDEVFNSQYGNATFNITDFDGRSNFVAYRVKYLGNRAYTSDDAQIKVGDVVIVYCEIMNFRGTTPESVSGGYLYALNGQTVDMGTPKGTGTLEDPFNPAGACAAAAQLTWTDNSNYETLPDVYIKGKITKIANQGTYTEGGSFGNGSFYIADAEDGTGEFYVFRALYLKNKKFEEGQTDIKVGDEVVVCGTIMNYRGNTPETVAGKAYLFSLNGDQGQDTPVGTPKGTGTLEDPYNPAGACAAVAQLTWTSDTEYETVSGVYVKGKISKIASKGTYTEGGTYGNASFYITDVEDGTGEFQVFRALYLQNQKFVAGQTDIKVGDEVVVCGDIMNYKGNTPETVAGKAYLYSLNGDQGQVTPPVDYENAPEKSISEFITAADTQNYYKLTGTVSGYNAQNCRMDIADETGASIYVYSVLNKDEWASKISNGGTIVLAGKYSYYEASQKHEVVDAYILSFIGAPTPELTLKGTGTLEDPYNPAAAANVVKDFTWTSNTEYQKTENDVYVKGKISSISNKGTYTEGGDYGNASFFIVDSEDGTGEFQVFRALYLKNQKFVAGQTDIKVGDEVVVCGKLMNYRGNTPETVSGEAYLYSLNGATESEVAPLFGVEKDVINVSASATSAVIKITGNSPWSIIGDGLQFSDTQGEGAKEVTVYFPANESEESEQTYMVYISTTAQVQLPRITVAIIQAKKPQPGTITDHVYTKVTGALEDYSGQYLIVYEASKAAFDGSLEKLDAVNDYKTVTIDNNSITLTAEEDTFFFTIDKTEKGYTIKSQSGNYIFQTTDANGLGTSTAAPTVFNTITVGNGEADIVCSNTHLRFNSASNQMRFRYYKSASYTAQKAIAIYKLAE